MTAATSSRATPSRSSPRTPAARPEGGATAAQKLASNPSLVGLIGSACSDETVGGIAAITNAGLTTISPSNTRPALTAPDRGPEYAGYLRTAFNDASQGKAVADVPLQRAGPHQGCHRP